MAYIEVPIETEPVDIADDAFSYIEAQVPGWLPSPGNLETWLVEALAQSASELRELAALVPESIFFFYGETVLGLPPFPAAPASGTTTWTAIDAAGYTVDAGTLVGVTPPAFAETYAFEVVEEFAIPAGATEAAGITIRAIEAGSAASGITGDVEMIDPLDFITSVTLNVPTSGGTDPEPIEDYLDRLSDLLTLLAPRPILPQDFSLMAVSAFPEIGRAVTIDLYNADTDTPNVPRCVTVIVVGLDGEPVDPEVKSDLDAYLEARREVNFLVFVDDPSYTTIDVTFTAKSYPGYIAADVEAQAEANVAAYLDPANWGVPPFGDPSTSSWINETSVRYLEIAEAINRTDGLHYIETLTIGVDGGAQAEDDIPLTGVAPLPRAGDIDGTVT